MTAAIADITTAVAAIMRARAIPAAATEVMEVVAGTAKKYGIEPGDRVGHPLFNGR